MATKLCSLTTSTTQPVAGNIDTYASGHDSCLKMQFTNLFLFMLIVQVSLGLLLSMTGPSLTVPPMQLPQQLCGTSENLITHLPTLDLRFNCVVPITGISTKPGLASPTIYASDPISIDPQDTDRTLGSGHGSFLKMQFTNPSLFVVQVDCSVAGPTQSSIIVATGSHIKTRIRFRSTSLPPPALHLSVHQSFHCIVRSLCDS
ncbi:hypothetical protein HPB51_019107 [Rhipicephalus microplus]|uniref:Uncharacterized protein n=1 Tax=Rhipicephalus microplus TaxID=6941 RepID=A0A9J6D7I0_RHIMP|nr:hypothetical protein HPB51_019107 [Rhipicephalus microplus]